jgi:hypothetical protein
LRQLDLRRGASGAARRCLGRLHEPATGAIALVRVTKWLPRAARHLADGAATQSALTARNLRALAIGLSGIAADAAAHADGC